MVGMIHRRGANPGKKRFTAETQRAQRKDHI
jgi:hypothetical protein